MKHHPIHENHPQITLIHVTQFKMRKGKDHLEAAIATLHGYLPGLIRDEVQQVLQEQQLQE